MRKIINEQIINEENDQMNTKRLDENQAISRLKMILKAATFRKF